MTAVATFAIATVLASAIVFLGWRLASRRRSLPCPSWLGWLVELDNPLFRNNRAAAIIGGLDLREGMSALDVDCGPGRITVPMTRMVGGAGRVVALDAQAGMLTRARAAIDRARLANVDFHQHEMGRGNSIPGNFDRATLVTVLGEIPDQQAALKEIFSGLKPGGILVVAEVIADPHFQRRAHVRALAAAAGFTENASTGRWFAYSLYLRHPT